MLQSKSYQTLLSFEQQQKYAAAIRYGFFANYRGNEWRHTFYGAWIWKHPGRARVVKRFWDMLGHLPDWPDLTDDNLHDFHEVLADNYSPNSVRTICAEMKAVIHENPSKKIPSASFSTILRQKREVTQAVFLTNDEIMAIHRLPVSRRNDCYVKRLFMLECLTGARVSDCARLTTANITDDGRNIVYVAQKSKHEVMVPLHMLAREYLVPKPGEPTRMHEYVYNNTLRAICRRCGIVSHAKVFSCGKQESGEKWQFVSSHTGRRSFATNLARKGVSLEQIAILMGHFTGNTPNVTMTQRYIVGKIKIDASVYHIFQTRDYQRHYPMYVTARPEPENDFSDSDCW